MSDNVSITPGSGNTVAADEVTDGTLGTVKVQYVKLMDGTLDGTTKGLIDSSGLKVGVSNFPVTQPVSGTITVSNPGLTDTQLRASPVPVSGTVTATTGGLTDAQLRATPVPISGTVSITDGSGPVTVDGTVAISNFPATQPVSGTVAVNNFPASQAVTGTFFQATQPVSLAVAPTTPVTGTFFQATQPVSLTSTTVTGTVAVTESGTWVVQTTPAILSVTATGAAAAAVTATLPAVAGQFHYITGYEIEAYSTVARVGGVTPVIVTSTNLPGSTAWTFATAAAVGTTDTKWYQTVNPIRSSVANTATTIVCPATVSIIWRVNVYYFTAA